MVSRPFGAEGRSSTVETSRDAALVDAWATRRGAPTADQEVVTVPRARRQHAVLASVGVLVLLVAGAAVLFAASSHVEVVAGDEVQAIRMLGGDVSHVLDRLDIEVADADRVDPHPAPGCGTGW